MRRAAVLIPLTSLLVAGLLGAGLYWFQPWKLWVDTRVDDPLPALALDAVDVRTTAAPVPGTPLPRTAAPAPRTAAPAAVPRLLARGTLISHEHATSGTVSIVVQADGSRVLAIAGLRTSDGPDVRVWLTDAPVIEGRAGWHVFDDGRHVSLGPLRGNLGDQVYRIPHDVDLRGLTSVSLWCDRFDVSFGAARLQAR